MSAQVEIRFNHLPGVGVRLDARDRDIRQKWSFDVYAASVPWTPVETGALVNNVEMGVGEVHWLQSYSGFQNEGTVHVPPKLFAQHGVEVATPGAIAAYQRIERDLV